MKILNFGSLNIDYVYQVEEIAKAGETVKGREKNVYCGGKGLNQSIALANAGAQVWHAGVIGMDGQILLDKLEKHGVNTEYVKTVQGNSSHTIIQVNPSGENCIIFYSDENLEVDEEYMRKILENFDAGDYLLVQNELNHTDVMMRLAKEKGLKVAFNPSPFTGDVLDYPLECVDIFLVNEIEGQQFTGMENPQYALDQMHERYPNAVIVLTMGKEGACCMAGDRIIMQEAQEVDTIDTTAAGDTFTGFFLAEYMRSSILETSLSLAARAAALAVTLPGASDSIPMLEEME